MSCGLGVCGEERREIATATIDGGGGTFGV